MGTAESCTDEGAELSRQGQRTSEFQKARAFFYRGSGAVGGAEDSRRFLATPSAGGASSRGTAFSTKQDLSCLALPVLDTCHGIPRVFPLGSVALRGSGNDCAGGKGYLFFSPF